MNNYLLYNINFCFFNQLNINGYYLLYNINFCYFNQLNINGYFNF